VNLIIELHEKKEPLWYITVQDETRSEPIVTLVAKDLKDKPAFLEVTPLQRFIRTQGQPLTVWDRLLEGDE
jgi:hypothetical protein